MIVDKNYGNIFEEGDFVIYDNIYKCIVIESIYPSKCHYTGDVDPGYLTVVGEGIEFSDYHHKFIEDKQRIREEKLNKLLL